MNARKRPHLLVEAIGLLRDRGLDTQLVLVGPQTETQYVASLQDKARALNVASLVSLPGFTRDVATMYRAADLFALPSANEGLPNALLEAMASGLPSIATAISGTIDLLTDGVHGRLIEPDAADIADAIGTYLSYPQLQKEHGQRARDLVVSRFSTAVVLEAHAALFQRVMAGKDAAG